MTQETQREPTAYSAVATHETAVMEIEDTDTPATRRRWKTGIALAVLFVVVATVIAVVVKSVKDLLEKNTETTQDQCQLSTGFTFHKFQREQAIRSYFSCMAKVHKDMAHYISIGSSYEQRDLFLLKVGLPSPLGIGKPAVWIHGGIHAREWISPATITYIAYELLKNSNKHMNIILMYDFYLMPLSNPDGYEYSHTMDRDWRKSRSHNNVSATNCTGTDPARNWGYQGGDSTAFLAPKMAPRYLFTYFYILAADAMRSVPFGAKIAAESLPSGAARVPATTRVTRTTTAAKNSLRSKHGPSKTSSPTHLCSRALSCLCPSTAMGSSSCTHGATTRTLGGGSIYFFDPKKYTQKSTSKFNNRLRCTMSKFSSLFLSFLQIMHLGMYFWVKEVLNHKPDAPNWRDMHSVAELAGSAMENNSGHSYTIGSVAKVIYPASGISIDWAKGELGISYAYTVELPDTGNHGFLLPASSIESVGREAFVGIEAMVQEL